MTAKHGFHSICVKDPIQIDGNYSHTLPVYATSTFVYENVEKAKRVFQGKDKAYIYSRWHNPTIDAVERKIAALETHGLNKNANAVLFSSGMSAITALLMSLPVKKGDAVITQGNLYGTTIDLFNTIFRNLGVKVLYENLKDLNKTEDLIRKNKNIRLLYIETPANPTCECYDIKALALLARKHHLLACIDNTFATPYLQQPFKFGFEVIIHSTTKFLNGHGTALGGILISTSSTLIKKAWNIRKLTGSNSNAFDAFLLNNGLKTLPLRMERHCSNAHKVAEYLLQHPKIAAVHYPGLPHHPDYSLAKKQMYKPGGVLSFEIKGGEKAAMKMLNKLKFLTLTASIGTPDTLIQHPASMTHVKVPKAQRLQFGITDSLIRLSVGLEDIDDILYDLDQALK